MPYKVSVRNEQRADLNGGYSESFWNDASSDSQIEERATTLSNLLFNCKGFGANIPSVRLTEIGFFRNVNVVFTNLQSQAQGFTEDADGLTAKLLFKLTGANPKQTTKQWLGSLPDNVTARGGRFTWTTAFKRNWNALVAYLQGGNGWCMSKQDPAIQKVWVAAVTTAGVVTTIADHALLTGDLVRLSRVKFPTAVNKIYRITKLTNNTLQLNGFSTTETTIVIGNSTHVQKQARILVPTAKVLPLRASSHKVGRPFDLSIGKQTTR